MAGPGEQRGTALNTDEALVDRRRVEEALRDSEQWLRAVLASLPVLVVAYDRDMVCTMAEGRELAAIGLRPDEIIGRRVGELVQDPQMRQSAEAALDGVVSTCSAAVGDRVLDTYHSPLRAEDGTIIEGVIDLAYRDADGWVVVEIKTEPGSRDQAQLDRYVEAVAAATGAPARGILLVT